MDKDMNPVISGEKPGLINGLMSTES